MATAEQMRAQRRRRRRERQAVVFGSITAALAVTALGAAATYTGAINLPFLEREFMSPAPEPGVAVPPPPCLPPESTPVPYSSIDVTVLNGSRVSGLAGSTANDLSGRGFTISSTDNYPVPLPTTAHVLFGAEGLTEAYTLAAHLVDPVLVLDQREDATVHLVIGTAFTKLMDPEAVDLEPETPMESVSGCVPLEEALVNAVPAPAAEEDEEDQESEDGAEADEA